MTAYYASENVFFIKLAEYASENVKKSEMCIMPLKIYFWKNEQIWR